MGPTGNTRIVQIHPTRKCNLSCKHCYSSSSPQEDEAIDAAILKQAIEDLSVEGFEYVTFSGGEPLVYDPLIEVLAHARQVNMHTLLVSNGMLLSGKRLDALHSTLSGLVVSLDGKPDSHNKMRNSSRAFDIMRKNLPELRRRGINFGFLFTLTQYNLDELPWVVEFSLEAGAKVLQVHPLEVCGNAALELSDSTPDFVERAYAWALIEKYKKEFDGRLDIHLDLVPACAIENNPDQFFLRYKPEIINTQLAEQLSVLVIEPDGEVLPLQYGFPREYSLGNVNNQRISEMVEVWRDRLASRIHKLSTSLHSELTANRQGGLLNWYELLNEHARKTRSVTLPVSRMLEHGIAKKG